MTTQTEKTDAELIAEPDAALGTMLKQRDAWRRERAELKAELEAAKERLAALAWVEDDLDALTALQAIYRNPNTPLAGQLKALGIAIHFERAKPPSAVAVGHFSLFDHLEKSKVIDLEARRNAGKVEQPKLDLAPGETILGGPDSAA
jgi:hypothetical protein